MSIKTPFGNGGTDWSKYTHFGNESTVTITSANTFQTLLSITGEGYLSKSIFIGSTSAPKMKVTIDGTLVFGGMCNIDSQTGGILLESYIFNGATSDALKIRTPTGSTSLSVPTTLQQHPFTNTTTNAVVYLYQSLFFKSNLLIEITSTSTSTPIFYAYKGGYVV